MTEEHAQLQRIYDMHLGKRPFVRVLEAGCGSSSCIHFGDNVNITGIDISEKQLKRNASLHERIQGDLQSYPLQEGLYDCVVCYDVLEHLERPTKALIQMVKALKQDGVLILGLPNVLSTKGIITKLTPHSFHVLVYRYLFGVKNAGKDDIGPFRTYLHFSIRPHSLKQLASDNGLDVLLCLKYESSMQVKILRRSALLRLLWFFHRMLILAVTLGQIDPALSDIIMVMKKPGISQF